MFFLPFAATLADPGKARNGFLMGFCCGAFQLESLDKLLELQYIIAAWLVCETSTSPCSTSFACTLYYWLKRRDVWKILSNSLSELSIRALTMCTEYWRCWKSKNYIMLKQVKTFHCSSSLKVHAGLLKKLFHKTFLLGLHTFSWSFQPPLKAFFHFSVLSDHNIWFLEDVSGPRDKCSVFFSFSIYRS